jgi:methylmalonyl-CoA/ethylmalonyl-CoA epimerase
MPEVPVPVPDLSMLTALDHVGVAVADIDAALPFYRDTLGMALVHRETVEDQGVEAVLLDVGDSHVELISPLGPETGVARFLERRGAGLHHVAYRVSDIDAVLSTLAAAGVRLIDERPRIGIRQSRVAFIHPGSTGGVLTEIVQPASAH